MSKAVAWKNSPSEPLAAPHTTERMLVLPMQKTFPPLLLGLFVISGHAQILHGESPPLAPPANRRPADFLPVAPNPSLQDLRNRYSEDLMRLAATRNRRVNEVNAQGTWKATAESINNHRAPEWFQDAKFGMFVDWGLWSIAGWAPKKATGAMYPDWYEFRHDTDPAFMKYHEKNWGEDFMRDDFILLFTADNYQPEKLAGIARNAGMKYMVPFSKHHSGFCLWPSSFTRRNAGEMGPKRDLIQPLVNACHQEGLKFGFYFSVDEWEYPLIGADGALWQRTWGGQVGGVVGEVVKPYSPDMEKKASGKIAVRDFARDYLVPQATEFIDKYDPDLVWFDGEWSNNSETFHTYDIAAYFYNQAQGRKEVAVNDRYGMQDGKWLRSKRGDFFTNEYGDMEKEANQTVHAWEECRGISQSFGYNWQDTDENVIGAKAFLDMFVDIVAHGGNLLLIVNLDGRGAMPSIQERRLMEIGKWLAINGEGIYATRPVAHHSDGKVAFTRSKDNQHVYAIMKEWPGKELILPGIHPANASKVTMLGVADPLEWRQLDGSVAIRLPDKLQDQRHRPCEHAWVLKITTEVTAP